SRSDCTEHKQLAGRNIWMPVRCRVEQYTFRELRDEETMTAHVFESPLYVNEFSVIEFDLQPWPDNRFELKYTTPGTWVNDGTFPEVNGDRGVIYSIPANPDQLEQVVEAAREKYQGNVNPSKWSRGKLLFGAINVALLVGLVIFVL